MEFECGGHESGDDHEEDEANSKKGKRQQHRHTPQQIQQLEAFFKKYPHPDDNQRRQLSRELGLEPKQIKFWFQNKRTQTKVHHEKADNNSLRSENERIICENIAIREALKSVMCPGCGGPQFGDEGRDRSLQQLKIENFRLKEELERLSNCLTSVRENPWPEIPSILPTFGTSLDSTANNCAGHPTVNSSIPTLPCELMNSLQEMEKLFMIQTMASAKEELLQLLQMDEPMWMKSPVSGKYSLHRDNYEKMFPKSNHFTCSSARTESSKDSCIVAMGAFDLIDKFFDAAKWVDLFPTIVNSAKTLQVLAAPELRGSLHLMCEQTHILSPLVAPREFVFLRHCQQIKPGIWVVVDTSYNRFKESEDASPSRCWKLPSGCLIQDISNGKSRVTWVEHVQVDDRPLTHRLYRDLICGCQAYGANRWLLTLQRMCERCFFKTKPRTSQCHSLEGVVNTPEGRKSLMALSHRMIKGFCSILSMSNKLDFPHLSESNNSGVRLSVRKNSEPGQPIGLIVSAASSLWIPRSRETLFTFFKDENLRAQWDVLAGGNAVNEVAHITTGANKGNSISVIQPYIPTEHNVLILQESLHDALGALIVYCPIELESIKKATRGEDTTKLSLLPSGIVISSDGHLGKGTGASTSKGTGASTRKRPGRSTGSLVTVAFQVLLNPDPQSKQLDMGSVATVNTLVCSTVQRIKEALNCADLN